MLELLCKKSSIFTFFFILLHNDVRISISSNYSVIVIADERPDLSSAELKLKSAKQLKGKKKEKKSRLKSRNASVDTKSSDEMDEKEKNDQLLDSLTNIVITTAAEIVASIRFVLVTQFELWPFSTDVCGN